jgi:hypothetical protein
LIGTSFAVLGAILGASVGISIKIITNNAKLHYMVVPMGFVLGHIFLCPIFMHAKILINSYDPLSQV